MSLIKTREFDRDGFHIVIRFEYDTSGVGPDWLGGWSDTPGPGAIDHHETDTWLHRSDQGPWYFNPTNFDPKDPESPKYARHDYERAVAFEHGDWCLIGLIVIVYREGIELGHASLWGIESDSGEDYFGFLLEDELVPEATEDASGNLTKLLASLEGSR